jgi:hypothetical protein
VPKILFLGTFPGDIHLSLQIFDLVIADVLLLDVSTKFPENISFSVETSKDFPNRRGRDKK